MQYSQRHTIICEYTWGGVPIDINWSVQTSIYKQMEISLIQRGIIKPLSPYYHVI